MKRARHSSRHSARFAVIAGCALLAGIMASCGGTAPSSTSSGTTFKIPQSPVRAGQIDPPPGSALTSGPIGANPSKEHGVQLNVLSGILHDQPIYDGNFADPFALRTPNTLYIYASSSGPSRDNPAANVPVIGLARDNGFAGQFLGDALPTLPKWTVSGFQWGPAVWARPDGTYVLYYSTPATIPLGCLATPPATGCVRTTTGETAAACISRATATNPAGPFTDNFELGVHLPYRRGRSHRPQRVRLVQWDRVPAVEERRGLLPQADRHLFPATVRRWPLDSGAASSHDRRYPALGGRLGRGAFDDRGEQRLLAVLLRQYLG